MHPIHRRVKALPQSLRAFVERRDSGLPCRTALGVHCVRFSYAMNACALLKDHIGAFCGDLTTLLLEIALGTNHRQYVSVLVAHAVLSICMACEVVYQSSSFLWLWRRCARFRACLPTTLPPNVAQSSSLYDLMLHLKQCSSTRYGVDDCTSSVVIVAQECSARRP